MINTGILGIIEKCSSPTGDGNHFYVLLIGILGMKKLRNVVPRQGTETYHNKNTAIRNRLLRNVVPRQGTETYIQFPTASETIIEKCSSPTGDGNRQKALLLNTSTAH